MAKKTVFVSDFTGKEISDPKQSAPTSRSSTRMDGAGWSSQTPMWTIRSLRRSSSTVAHKHAADANLPQRSLRTLGTRPARNRQQGPLIVFDQQQVPASTAHTTVLALSDRKPLGLDPDARSKVACKAKEASARTREGSTYAWGADAPTPRCGLPRD